MREFKITLVESMDRFTYYVVAVDADEAESIAQEDWPEAHVLTVVEVEL